MSDKNDDPSIVQPEGSNLTSSRQSKIAYTREYLLSLSELEICKRLPKGVDESLLSEFRSSPEQGFRRKEHGSSPPGKGETGDISRGFQRWDNRSSWRSDSDSQSDRDSDSGRRYGNQLRRSWPNPEHDGLLGSGSLPKPPGYGPGSSAPRSGANDQRQMNRSNDPYHPPRPYKAPNSWRETKDSFNDETFGLAEGTSEDRVEEERKRRAEFEMMRKEQQKILQENMKSKARRDKLKVDPLTELAASLDAEDNAILTIGSDTSLAKSIQQNDSGKASISSQGHPVRPLVPPGFANAAPEKISGLKSIGNPIIEVGKLETGNDNQEKKLAVHLNLNEKHFETTSLWASKGGENVDLSSAFELSSKVKDTDNLSSGATKISGVGEILDNDKSVGINSQNENGHIIVGEDSHSTSVLENLFEGALNIQSTSPSNIIKDLNMKTDIDSSPQDLHSSKFAQWFLEEEKKSVESGSSEKPNPLLSLIVCEKSGLIPSETKTAWQVLPPESNFMKMGSLTPSAAGVSDPFYDKNKPERISAVLTCEDLEQSILSDIGGSSSSSQPPGIIFNQHGFENEIPIADINNNASQQLLSLLQKGIGSNSKTTAPISVLDKSSPLHSETKTQGHLRPVNAEHHSSGKGLTLETLFGAAFMSELQSSEAPISVQRNFAESSSGVVSEPSMLPVAVSADGSVNSSVSEARYIRVNNDDSVLGLGRARQINLENARMNWLTADSSQTEAESSNLRRFNVQHPVEDGLNSSPFSRGPFETPNPEMPYPNMNSHSSPQLNHMLANHGRQIFPPLDPHAAHINPHFMQLEGITHQDAAIRHQMSTNLGHSHFRHPNSGYSEFDHPIHPMLQQMHMPNNLPPSPIMPGFHGGTPSPLHPGGNPPGYIQDHSFPFGQQQSNLLDARMPLQGAEHGGPGNSHPSQAFQRLLEMELRGNKITHPSFPAASGHSEPLYGHELDTGLWYR